MQKLTITNVLDDPCTSHWLRDAILILRERDPLDALNDAETLHKLMSDRWGRRKPSAQTEKKTR